MLPFFGNADFSIMNYVDFLIRILVAAVCGGLIGMEREIRLKNAGLRTHIIVAITASIMMIVSKYGFFDVVSVNPDLRVQVDVSRIAHGVISAIGFLGAGVIFVRRESVVGLTTAACLWATVAVGLTIGSGLVAVGVITTGFILFVQFVLHRFHSKAKRQCAGTVKCNISKYSLTIEDYQNVLSGMRVTIRDMSFYKNQDGQTIVSSSVIFPPDKSMVTILDDLVRRGIFENADVSPAV